MLIFASSLVSRIVGDMGVIDYCNGCQVRRVAVFVIQAWIYLLVKNLGIPKTPVVPHNMDRAVGINSNVWPHRVAGGGSELCVSNKHRAVAAEHFVKQLIVACTVICPHN